MGFRNWTKVGVCRYSMEKRHPQKADILVLTSSDKEKPWEQQQHLQGRLNTASTEHMSKEECYHENHTSLWCHPATPSPQTVFFSEFYVLFITMTLPPGLHSPSSFAQAITDVFFKGTCYYSPPKIGWNKQLNKVESFTKPMIWA